MSAEGLKAENDRLRATVNDQANTIIRLHHEIKMLHRTLASQYLAFKYEAERLLANQKEPIT